MSLTEIWTDGSADNVASRVGGWAALLRFGPHEKVISGSEVETTNQRMELTAAAEALESLKRPAKVRLYSDSKYLILGAQGRNKKVKANHDLWARIFEQKARHEVEWVHVKGHAGVPENELVHDHAIREFRQRAEAESKKEPAEVLDLMAARERLKDAERSWPPRSVECAKQYSDGTSESITYHRLLPLVSNYGDPDAPKIVVNGRKGILLNVIMPKARVVFDDAPPAEHLSTKRRPCPASEDVPAVDVRPIMYTSQKKGV